MTGQNADSVGTKIYKKEMIERTKGTKTEDQIQDLANENFRNWVGDKIISIAKENRISYRKGLIEGLALGIIGNVFVTAFFNLSKNPLSVTYQIIAGISLVVFISVTIWFLHDLKKMMME